MLFNIYLLMGLGNYSARKLEILAVGQLEYGDLLSLRAVSSLNHLTEGVILFDLILLFLHMWSCADILAMCQFGGHFSR